MIKRNGAFYRRRPVCYSKGEISMAEDVACKVHIQYTLNAVCKIVIVKTGTFASR